jgi:hypothetical protein
MVWLMIGVGISALVAAVGFLVIGYRAVALDRDNEWREWTDRKSSSRDRGVW